MPLNADLNRTLAPLLALSLFLSAGCSKNRPILLPIPDPDLSNLRPQVIQQLNEWQAKLETFYTKTGGQGEQLGLAFGEMGRLYHAYQMHEPARDCYTNATLLQPEEFRWHYYLGQLESQTGATEAAFLELNNAAGMRPGNIPTLVALGKLHYEAGNYRAAIERFESILEVDGRNAVAHFYLGQVALDQNQFQRAVDHFRAALSAQPNASRIRYPLAQAYQGLGNQALAKRHLAKRGSGPLAIKDPLMLELRELALGARQYLDAGAAAFRNGNYQRAVALFAQAVEEEPESVEGHHNLASALVKTGEGAEAVVEYQAALALDNNYLPAHYDLATVLSFQGAHGEALEHLRSVERIDPGYKALPLKLGSALAELDRCNDAKAYFETALSRNPGDRRARDGLARCRTPPKNP